MAVLVDTSVWVDHFRRRNDVLVSLLVQDAALCHPMVLAELACGTPPAPRERTLGDIGLLKSVQQADLLETRAFVEGEKLFGLGCGLVDLVLLASTLISPGARLWTLDKRLGSIAQRFGVGYEPGFH